MGELLESPNVSVSMFSVETSISLVIMAVPFSCATRFLFFNCFEAVFFSLHCGSEVYGN